MFLGFNKQGCHEGEQNGFRDSLFDPYLVYLQQLFDCISFAYYTFILFFI